MPIAQVPALVALQQDRAPQTDPTGVQFNGCPHTVTKEGLKEVLAQYRCAQPKQVCAARLTQPAVWQKGLVAMVSHPTSPGCAYHVYRTQACTGSIRAGRAGAIGGWGVVS